MTGTGKNYRKGDPLRGVAILILTCERQGIPEASAKVLIAGTCQDLGVEVAAARDYLKKHRAELTAMLDAQSNA